MEIVLRVGGMSCNHCVERVKKAILQVEGVKDAHVELEGGGRARIDLSDETALPKVKEAIREAGYQVG